jgi:hypothetical protein
LVSIRFVSLVAELCPLLFPGFLSTHFFFMAANLSLRPDRDFGRKKTFFLSLRKQTPYFPNRDIFALLSNKCDRYLISPM